jgi:hypothetical protein
MNQAQKELIRLGFGGVVIGVMKYEKGLKSALRL